MVHTNLDTAAVWKVLDTFSLDDAKKEILKRSFRTRAKWGTSLDYKWEVLDFQFKWLSFNMSEEQRADIEFLMIELQSLLKKHFKWENVTLTYKIGVCCGENCFCCQEYAKKLKLV